MNKVQAEIEKVLQVYAQGSYLETLKNAKDVFFKKTGKIDEDSEEYESRMSSFNDWYVFQYQLLPGSSVIQDYYSKSSGDLVESLTKTAYSVFVFQKISFRKQIIIKDILHNTKFVLSRDNGNLSLVENDIFVGRMVVHENEAFLLNGLCLLPSEILSALKKECKRVRKEKITEEEEFLLNLERLKTKSVQYGHIDPAKIFTF